jgi:arginine decarboxylase
MEVKYSSNILIEENDQEENLNYQTRKAKEKSSFSNQSQENWTIKDSQQLYQIQEWGEPYFSVNEKGNVTVSPNLENGKTLDLFDLVESLKKRKINPPLLIRFLDILEDRIKRLNSCFYDAIARYEYPGTYQGVYPVKCNQHRHLVEALVKYGKPYNFGLEAGSKPELMIALAMLEPDLTKDINQEAPLLICNGYKDKEYVKAALLANRIGQKTIIVIEQLEELYLILEVSQELDIKPTVGVRVKLSKKSAGRWETSTGDRAKFGLTIPEILTVVKEFEKLKMLDSLQLLHFHIGSQISSIGVIKDAIREASQVYGELVNLGANMQYLDVGGGLAVDYDGSKSKFYGSKNYNMQNYANDVVAGVQETCEKRKIPVPILMSESGRAVISHQSVLIFNVLTTSDINNKIPEPIKENSHSTLVNFWETYQSINLKNCQESYYDAIQLKEEALSLFELGYLSLEERGKAEDLYWACCQKVLQTIRENDYLPDDLLELENKLASIYYVNFSVFRSVCDSWAIEQLFPIMPIHRLNEKPDQLGILVDLTCDSDGKIDRFINVTGVKNLLELHTLEEKETSCDNSNHLINNGDIKPYYLGLFLVGAYQENLGSLHNLFGDTNVVHITVDSQGYEITSLVKGDTIKDVLTYVQYNVDDLIETIRRRTEKALQNNQITLEESQLLLQNYTQSLRSYTYLVED